MGCAIVIGSPRERKEFEGYIEDNFQDLDYDRTEIDPSLKYYKNFKSKNYIQTKALRKPKQKKPKASKPSRSQRKRARN